MLIPILQNILLFFIYSFLGWVCETVYCSIGGRRFVNRGFLNGPLCPVYGFGALIVVWAMQPFYKSVLLTFVAGVVLTSILEYITGWLLETLFHLKLWDYSERFLNINGRVCLKNSLMFGILAVVTVFYIHPLFLKRIRAIPQEWMILLTGFLLGLLIADLAVTIYTVLKMNGRLKQMQATAEELYVKAEVLRAELSENTRRFGEGVQKQMEERRKQLSDRLVHLKEKSKNLTYDRPKLLERRILRAFPHMRQTRYPEALDKLKKTLSSRKKKQ